MHTAVPAGVAVLCLGLAAAFWFIGDHFPRVVVLLVTVGSMGLSGSIGNGLHSAVTSMITGADRATVAATGAGIAVLAAVLATYVLYIHLRDRDIRYSTLGTAATLPWLAAAAPGPIGSFLLTGLGVVASLFSALGTMAGIH